VLFRPWQEPLALRAVQDHADGMARLEAHRQAGEPAFAAASPAVCSPEAPFLPPPARSAARSYEPAPRPQVAVAGPPPPRAFPATSPSGRRGRRSKSSRP